MTSPGWSMERPHPKKERVQAALQTKERAHKYRFFGLVALGTTKVVPGTTPGLSLFHPAEAQFVSGTNVPGIRAAERVYVLKAGWLWFSLMRLRFVHGTVRAVPVFGSDSSFGETFYWYLVLQ